MKLTKYERARIIGARALQIAMGAPILLKLKKQDYEDRNFNPINIAKKEFVKDVIPMAIRRPLPTRAIVKRKN